MGGSQHEYCPLQSRYIFFILVWNLFAKEWSQRENTSGMETSSLAAFQAALHSDASLKGKWALLVSLWKDFQETHCMLHFKNARQENQILTIHKIQPTNKVLKIYLV